MSKTLDHLLASAAALLPPPPHTPPHHLAAFHNLAADVLAVTAELGDAAGVEAARNLLDGVRAWVEYEVRLRPLSGAGPGEVLGVRGPPVPAGGEPVPVWWLAVRVMKSGVRVIVECGERPPAGAGVEVGYWAEEGGRGWWRVPSKSGVGGAGSSAPDAPPPPPDAASQPA